MSILAGLDAGMRGYFFQQAVREREARLNATQTSNSSAQTGSSPQTSSTPGPWAPGHEPTVQQPQWLRQIPPAAEPEPEVPLPPPTPETEDASDADLVHDPADTPEAASSDDAPDAPPIPDEAREVSLSDVQGLTDATDNTDEALDDAEEALDDYVDLARSGTASEEDLDEAWEEVELAYGEASAWIAYELRLAGELAGEDPDAVIEDRADDIVERQDSEERSPEAAELLDDVMTDIRDAVLGESEQTRTTQLRLFEAREAQLRAEDAEERDRELMQNLSPEDQASILEHQRGLEEEAEEALDAYIEALEHELGVELARQHLNAKEESYEWYDNLSPEELEAFQALGDDLRPTGLEEAEEQYEQALEGDLDITVFSDDDLEAALDAVKGNHPSGLLDGAIDLLGAGFELERELEAIESGSAWLTDLEQELAEDDPLSLALLRLEGVRLDATAPNLSPEEQALLEDNPVVFGLSEMSPAPGEELDPRTMMRVTAVSEMRLETTRDEVAQLMDEGDDDAAMAFLSTNMNAALSEAEQDRLWQEVGEEHFTRQYFAEKLDELTSPPEEEEWETDDPNVIAEHNDPALYMDRVGEYMQEVAGHGNPALADRLLDVVRDEYSTDWFDSNNPSPGGGGYHDGWEFAAGLSLAVEVADLGLPEGSTDGRAGEFAEWLADIHGDSPHSGLLYTFRTNDHALRFDAIEAAIADGNGMRLFNALELELVQLEEQGEIDFLFFENFQEALERGEQQAIEDAVDRQNELQFEAFNADPEAMYQPLFDDLLEQSPELVNEWHSLSDGDAQLRNFIGAAMMEDPTNPLAAQHGDHDVDWFATSGDQGDVIAQVEDWILEVGGEDAEVRLLPTLYAARADGVSFRALFEVRSSDGETTLVDAEMARLKVADPDADPPWRYGDITEFQEENLLSDDGDLYMPTGGELTRGENGHAEVERIDASVTTNRQKWEERIDLGVAVVATVGGIALTVGTGGLAAPAALTVKGLAWGAVGASMAWGGYRSYDMLSNMSDRGQSLHFSNAQARTAWLGLAATAAGGMSGLAQGVSHVARTGSRLYTAAGITSGVTGVAAAGTGGYLTAEQGITLLRYADQMTSGELARELAFMGLGVADMGVGIAGMRRGAVTIQQDTPATADPFAGWTQDASGAWVPRSSLPPDGWSQDPSGAWVPDSSLPPTGWAQQGNGLWVPVRDQAPATWHQRPNGLVVPEQSSLRPPSRLWTPESTDGPAPLPAAPGNEAPALPFRTVLPDADAPPPNPESPHVSKLLTQLIEFADARGRSVEDWHKQFKGPLTETTYQPSNYVQMQIASSRMGPLSALVGDVHAHSRPYDRRRGDLAMALGLKAGAHGAILIGDIPQGCGQGHYSHINTTPLDFRNAHLLDQTNAESYGRMLERHRAWTDGIEQVRRHDPDLAATIDRQGQLDPAGLTADAPYLQQLAALDPALARDVERMAKQNPYLAMRVDLSMTGFNPGTPNAVNYVRGRLLEYPGHFWSLGEMTLNKEMVTALLGDQAAPVKDPVTQQNVAALLGLSEESGINVLIHSDWGQARNGPDGRPEATVMGYELLDPLVALASKYPAANIVLAHTGIGRYVRPDTTMVSRQVVDPDGSLVTRQMPRHIARMEDVLDRAPHVRFDISWNDVGEIYAGDPAMRQGLLDFIARHPTAVMFGSDTVKPENGGQYRQAFTTLRPFLAELGARSPEALWSVLRGNYEALSSDARGRVADWTEARFAERGDVAGINQLRDTAGHIDAHKADYVAAARAEFDSIMQSVSSSPEPTQPVSSGPATVAAMDSGSGQAGPQQGQQPYHSPWLGPRPAPGENQGPHAAIQGEAGTARGNRPTAEQNQSALENVGGQTAANGATVAGAVNAAGIPFVAEAAGVVRGGIFLGQTRYREFVRQSWEHIFENGNITNASLNTFVNRVLTVGEAAGVDRADLARVVELTGQFRTDAAYILGKPVNDAEGWTAQNKFDTLMATVGLYQIQVDRALGVQASSLEASDQRTRVGRAVSGLMQSASMLGAGYFFHDAMMASGPEAVQAYLYAGALATLGTLNGLGNAAGKINTNWVERYAPLRWARTSVFGLLGAGGGVGAANALVDMTANGVTPETALMGLVSAAIATTSGRAAVVDMLKNAGYGSTAPKPVAWNAYVLGGALVLSAIFEGVFSEDESIPGLEDGHFRPDVAEVDVDRPWEPPELPDVQPRDHVAPDPHLRLDLDEWETGDPALMQPGPEVVLGAPEPPPQWERWAEYSNAWMEWAPDLTPEVLGTRESPFTDEGPDGPFQQA